MFAIHRKGGVLGLNPVLKDALPTGYPADQTQYLYNWNSNILATRLSCPPR